MKRQANTTSLLAVVLSFLALLITGAPLLADSVRFAGGLSRGLADSLYCALAGSTGCTMTGGTIYSGVTDDITAAGSEDLKITPGTAGTGSVQIGDGDGIIDLLNASGAVNGLINMTVATGPQFQMGTGTNDSIIRSTDAVTGQGMFVTNVSDVADTANLFSVGDSAIATLFRVMGTGTVLGHQLTTGTPVTWRVPTWIGTTGYAAPTCATSADAGEIFYVDDGNDTAVATLCVCRAGADDSTYALVKVDDNATACIAPTALADGIVMEPVEIAGQRVRVSQPREADPHESLWQALRLFEALTIF